MTDIQCPQCAKRFEDALLCCPHCGAAQIPQLSRAQLRLEFMKASSGALPFIYLGLVFGLLAGAAYLAFRLVNGTADFGSAMAVLLGGMSGSAAGFVVYYLRREPRRKKPALSDRTPATPP